MRSNHASWWITNSRGRSDDRRDFAARAVELGAEADRVAQSVAKRLSASQAVIDLDGLQARKEEQARELQARELQAKAQQAKEQTGVSNAPPVQASYVIKFRLRGVVPTGAHPVAFIDDRTVGLGEEVAGFKIVAIAAESVTFVDPLVHKRVVKLYGD